MLLLGVIIVCTVLALLDNLATKPCTVYLAQPMSGFDKAEMVQLAKQAVFIAESYGLKPWSPVLQEQVSGRGKLKADDSLNWKWPMDKEALNNCFVFVNLRADEKSFGCENEYGRHRYSEFQPSFLISPKHASGYKSIANYQADGLFGDMHSCFRHIGKHYGGLQQRQWFKLRIWGKSTPKWVWRQVRRLFQ